MTDYTPERLRGMGLPEAAEYEEQHVRLVYPGSAYAMMYDQADQMRDELLARIEELTAKWERWVQLCYEADEARLAQMQRADEAEAALANLTEKSHNWGKLMNELMDEVDALKAVLRRIDSAVQDVVKTGNPDVAVMDIARIIAERRRGECECTEVEVSYAPNRR